MNTRFIMLLAGFALIVSLAIVLADRLLFEDGPVLSPSSEVVDLKERVPLANVPAGAVNSNRGVIRFGFDLRASPEEDARQYLPFLKHLEKTTGYIFELRFTNQDGELFHDLGKGVVDLAGYDYTGSHQKCAGAVIAAMADACGMQDTMGRDLARRNIVRIVYTSPFFPSSGIAANPKLPQPVLEKIRQALIDFQPLGRDKDGLYDWHRTEMPNGFTAATADDYDVLEEGMKRLGLIQ